MYEKTITRFEAMTMYADKVLEYLKYAEENDVKDVSYFLREIIESDKRIHAKIVNYLNN